MGRSEENQQAGGEAAAASIPWRSKLSFGYAQLPLDEKTHFEVNHPSMTLLN